MMNNKTHSVKYNFVMNFILTSTQFLFPLITFPYVSRVLLAEGNGRIAFASSVANYFLMIASLGIPTYGIRECAQSKDDKEELTQVVQELFIINALMTALVLVSYISVIAFVPKFRDDSTLFAINAVNIALNCFGINWLFQALEKYDYITIRSIAFKIISIILMFALVKSKSDVEVYAAITVLASVGSNLLNLTQLHNYIDLHKRSYYNLKRHIKPILVMFSQTLMASIYANLDTIMLGFMKSSHDVGLYNAAVKIKGLLISLATSLGSVLLPRMSYYFKSEQTDKFNELAVKAINFTLFLSIPLALYFVLYADTAILFLSGQSFIGAVPAMRFVVISVIPIGVTGVLGIQILIAEGKEKYVLLSVGVGAAVDLILNFALIPRYSAAGAAFATMIAEFLVLAVQAYYKKDLLVELSSGFQIKKYLLMVACGLLIGIAIKQVKIDSDFFTLLLSATLYFGVYGIVGLLMREPFSLDIIKTGLKMIKRGNKQ